MLHDVKITSDPSRPAKVALLTIDGQEFTMATGLKFEAKPDHFATATLEFISQAFTYEGVAAVGVSDETAELLVKLGWTPPTDQ